MKKEKHSNEPLSADLEKQEEDNIQLVEGFCLLCGAAIVVILIMWIWSMFN